MTKTNSLQTIILHPKLLEILFECRREVSRKFSDVLGIYYFDHVTTMIINPHNQAVIFSSTPSIEYNLIKNELWVNDGHFLLEHINENEFFWWPQAYAPKYFNDIQKIRETDHACNLGITIVKNIHGFTNVYSFATRCKKPELKEYYRDHLDEITKMGDYCYKRIRETYLHYSESFSAPEINELHCPNTKNRSNLRLVVNNTT